ncbi:Uncharacterised protein [Vibrio cholerae]|nr:Uncharacterised protein [Vibrio cholerae]
MTPLPAESSSKGCGAVVSRWKCPVGCCAVKVVPICKFSCNQLETRPPSMRLTEIAKRPGRDGLEESV